MISNISVNNISYDWQSIEIHVIGVGLASYSPSGVSSLNYNTTHNIDYDYSRTGFAVGRKFGNFESNANITLDYYEIRKLDLFTMSKLIKPFDIKVVYSVKSDTNILTKHIDTLYGCVPSYPDNIGGNQGDMGLEATIELNPVWIKYDRV